MVIYKNQEGFPRIFPRVFQGCDVENREKATWERDVSWSYHEWKSQRTARKKKMTYSYRKDRLGQQANWSRVHLLGAMEHGLNSACC